MRQVVLIMHRPLASAFAQCVQHVLGSKPPLHVIDIAPNADVGASVSKLTDILTTPPARDHVVLCDLYGATPFNIAQTAVENARSQGANVALISGANLCMVIKALTDPMPNLAALQDSAIRGGHRGIVGDQNPD